VHSVLNLRPYHLLTVWRLTIGTTRAFLRHDGFDRAASIAYYALLSIFPLLLGLTLALGVVLESIQEDVLNLVGEVLPTSKDLVLSNIRSLVDARGAVGVITFLGLLWSGRAVFGAVRRALDAVWEHDYHHPLHHELITDFGLAIGSGLLLTMTVMASAIGGVLEHLEPFTNPAGLLLAGIISTYAPFAGTFLLFLLVYRFLPSVLLSWREIWPGALLGSLLFELAKSMFFWYVVLVGNYALVYGSLASAVAFMVWAYFSAIVVLIGAEFSVQLSRMLAAAANPD